VPPPSSSSNGAEDSLFGQVAGEFSKRLARGESPEIDERLTRYPQIATWIRDVFPALQALHDPHDPAAVNGATHGRRRPWMELGEHQRLADFLILRELGRGRGTSETDRAKQTVYLTSEAKQTVYFKRSEADGLLQAKGQAVGLLRKPSRPQAKLATQSRHPSRQTAKQTVHFELTLI